MAGELFLVGLASGLDTAAVVDRLMQLERRPLDRLSARQRAEEARRQALADVRSRLQALASAVAALRSPSSWAEVQAVASSDPTRVTAVRTAGAAPGAYAVAVSALASADQVRQAAGGASQASADGTLDITVDGATVSVEIAAGDDLDAIAAKINAASGSPVYATVVSGRLYLSGKETGASKTIAVASTALADELGLSDATRAPSDHTIVASDASIAVNGTSFLSPSNTVATAIPGLVLQLHATTAADSPVTISVGAPQADREAVREQVKAFVDAYNAAVSFLSGKLAERRSARDPAQGVLAGEAGLMVLLGRLRQAVVDVVDPPPGSGSLSSLAEVGVSTGAATGSGAVDQEAVAGRLVLDSTKLEEALGAALADVRGLFTATAGTYQGDGVAVRLQAILDPWLSGDDTSPPLLQARIDGQQATLDALARRRAELERRLADRERALREQFAALEALLQQAQSQGAWLSAQLAQLTRR